MNGFLVAPMLPIPLIAAVALLTLGITVLAMMRTQHRAAAFVVGSTWLRFIMQAAHPISYQPLIAGMSSNALVSIGVFFTGLCTINLRLLALRFLLPFYLMIVIAIVSALANQGPFGGLITVVTKFGYLIVVTLSVYGALRSARGGQFMATLLWAFAPILLFQALSVVLGVAKATEGNLASRSYIGGFNHEAVFSVILATCLIVATFADRMNKLVKNAVIVACIAGIVLANYRTTLVAIAPVLLFYFGFSSLHRFPVRDRPFVISVAAVLALIAMGLASSLFAARFEDLSVVLSGDINLIKPPFEYSVEETRLLSGRPRIWSMYIYGWAIGSPVQHLIGYGPEAWDAIFPLYAHNTLVSILFEYGVIGVAGMLFLWLSMLLAAFRVRHAHRPVLIGAHLTFITLNMSTMPMWMIEGNMLYGIICGYTLYLLSLQSQRAPLPSRPAPETQAQGA